MNTKMKILLTGASGYIGSQLIELLLQHNFEVIGTDIAPPKSKATYRHFKADLRTDEVGNFIRQEQPDVVVHLAAIVAPTKSMTRDFIYDVEVNGTKKILAACVDANVKHFVNTSSGAAYGYHNDNPDWITEECAIRGNQEFAYAYHKKLIEDLLSDYRKNHPQLNQTIFRVSTILGNDTKNDITNLFEKNKMLGIQNYATPFVIIWDKDLIRILEKSIVDKRYGIFNVAGDGIVTLKEMANLLNKPYVELPAWLIRSILTIGKPLKLVRYGPEQVKFLQYRPVLDNQKLKEEFGYQPQKTSKEVFIHYAKHNKLMP